MDSNITKWPMALRFDFGRVSKAVHSHHPMLVMTEIPAAGNRTRTELLRSGVELQSASPSSAQEELDRFSQWFGVSSRAVGPANSRRDVLAGRFNVAGRRSDADFEAGRCTPLSQ